MPYTIVIDPIIQSLPFNYKIPLKSFVQNLLDPSFSMLNQLIYIQLPTRNHKIISFSSRFLYQIQSSTANTNCKDLFMTNKILNRVHCFYHARLIEFVIGSKEDNILSVWSLKTVHITNFLSAFFIFYGAHRKKASRNAICLLLEHFL